MRSLTQQARGLQSWSFGCYRRQMGIQDGGMGAGSLDWPHESLRAKSVRIL